MSDRRNFFVPLQELLLIILIFVMLLALTITFMVSKDRQQAENSFHHEAELLHQDLTQKITDMNATLNGLVALYNSVGVVETEQYSHYAQQILVAYPAITKIKILTRLDADFIKPYTETMSRQGFPDFALVEGERTEPEQWSKVSQRPYYFPVTAIVPLTSINLKELGYDYYAATEYRQLIDASIVRGETLMLEDYDIVAKEPGLSVVKPIFSKEQLFPSPDERWKSTLYIAMVFIPYQHLIKNLSETIQPVHLYLKNPVTGVNTQVFRPKSIVTEPRYFKLADFSYNKPINIEGVSLLLSINKQVGWEVVRLRYIAAAIIIGSLFAILILIILNANYRRRHELKESLTAWQWEKERADVTLHSLADAVITTDLDGVIDYMNPVAEKLTGWKAYHAVGQDIEDVIRLVDEHTDERIVCPVIECMRRSVMKHSADDVLLVQRDGEKLSIDYSVAPMRDRDKKILGSVMVFQDVGSSRMMSRMLTYQATHDDLTGLYNRRELERRLSRAIDQVFKQKSEYALIYMDLDQFKVINNRCGHVGGDLVLKQISELLIDIVPQKTAIARLGGDEFGILLESCSLDEAQSIAEKILETIRQYRFHWTGKIFEIGVSIGIVMIDTGLQSVSNVMGNADTACYLAKELRGNNIQVYRVDDQDYQQRKEQMEWIQRITQAFADDRFVLYAQKIVSLQHTTDEHYEVLMRMVAPDGQLVVPQEYIISAERYGSMQDIDRWVVRNAFIHISKYVLNKNKHPELPNRYFAINLSGHTLGSDVMVEYVAQQLSEFPEIIPYIIFEITETEAINNMARAQHFLMVFRTMGVRFSLDDFGTGVSSFNYLKNLKVDYLKIDGMFIREMMNDPVDYAMVKSITQIGHIMRIKTIAEHAETKEICDSLNDIGVDYAQGYFLHEPEKLDNLLD